MTLTKEVNNSFQVRRGQGKITKIVNTLQINNYSTSRTIAINLVESEHGVPNYCVALTVPE